MQPTSAEQTQRYVSEELIHFVGRSLPTNAERYELLKKILGEGELRNPNVQTAAVAGGLATKLQGDAVIAGTADGRIGEVVVHQTGSVRGDDMIIASVVCLCDIPDDDLPLHMGKYSEFGIGFLKSFLVLLDVRPVFYLPLSSVSIIGGSKRPQWEAFDEKIKHLFGLITFQLKQELKRPGLDPHRPSKLMLRLKQMFEFLARDVFGFVKVFDDALTLDDPDNYYMEREWRSTASIKFQLDDVSSIVLPAEFVDTFIEDFPGFHGIIKSVHGRTVRPIHAGSHGPEREGNV